MVDLRDFLLGYLDKPMVWGQDDCSLLIADWWRSNHGVDPAAHLRGTYSTEEGKAAIVEAAGGIIDLVTGIASGVGARQSAANEDGSFGVVAVGERTVVGGIRAGRFWAVRSATGIGFTSRAKLLRGWAI